MADQSVRGQFVWHELKTPDANAAHAFYGKAIGWKSQPWEQDPSYVMFAAGRGPVGATAAQNGAAPHWLPYIGTGDIEKTVKQAQDKGGSVVKDIDSLATGSRHAVLKDPFGATFGVYESAEDYGTMTPPQPGEHSWHELMTGDYRAAFDFYSSLFGWQKMDEHDMGELGTYMIWGLNGRQMGGMFKAMEGAPPAWLGYVSVKDVHQTARKVKSAGGKVVNGPMEVPGGGWIVQVVDPQGAMFAAHAPAGRQLEAPKKQKKVKAAAAETPAPVVEDQETPAAEDAPPADKAPEEKAPAKKAPRKKAPAKEAPAQEAPPAEEAPAEEAPAKQAPARKAPAKKAPSKKAPAKKKSPPAKKSSKMPAKKKAGKKAGKKKAPASKGAGAKKSAKKGSKKVKTRSGGSKKAAKQPRKKK
jgi:predicted enzyme related to lactoylglutathione lyase